jgi:hypothetical protein
VDRHGLSNRGWSHREISSLRLPMTAMPRSALKTPVLSGLLHVFNVFYCPVSLLKRHFYSSNKLIGKRRKKGSRGNAITQRL